MARAQHVVAREAGFNRWEDLLHASADGLQFGVIIYKNPLLTEIEGWSYPGHKVNPYKESDRQSLINNYDWVMRIVSWLRTNNICEPVNSGDEYLFHTGTGKDCFSRLFVHLFNEAYKYTGTGLVIAAFMMCGFKPLSLNKRNNLPIPGQGRCYFAVSEKWWNDMCKKYSVLER